MDKRVVILRGVPGCGKSSFVRELSKKSGLCVCSADAFMVDEDGGYDFNPAKLTYVHSMCMSFFIQYMASGRELIVVDNTNIRRIEYQNYAAMAALQGYKVEIVEFVVDTVDAIKQCAKRNTHGVPVEVVAKMALDFEPNPKATRIPFTATEK